MKHLLCYFLGCNFKVLPSKLIVHVPNVTITMEHRRACKRCNLLNINVSTTCLR